MSKYKTIETQFRDLAGLTGALTDLGIAFEQHAEPVALYGYRGDKRPERAHIIVRRQHISLSSNDIGLVWDATTKSYRAIVSEYDEQEGYGTALLNRIRQRYAVRETIRLAQSKGLSVIEQKDEHGVIRLRLAGYRR